ncbi:MAG TPA: carboxypeptidase regulatory-like domain-containing protein, partial [Acidobacteriota bacterium]|nr:carboxypeptidase regulatory-like domain-containing protein [Acidobacteriota bacterium]
MLCLFALSALIAVPAMGQTTAMVVGTVLDPSGAVVPNVQITITQTGTGMVRHVQSNERGVYVAPALPVGSYAISAEASGFKSKTITGIVLQVNQEARIDLTLDVGQVSETVTVVEETPLLQSESAVVGQVIDNRFNSEIPLNGRDFAQLILLTPGATTRPGSFTGDTGAATGSLGSGVAIGGRDSQNNFMIDGASNNARQFGNIAIKPSIDAVQEFKVLTNSYSSEFGSAAFGQISLITKSGSNQFRGTLFEFLRNDVLDARNFFLPKKSKLNRNQFGGVVGGPIWSSRAFFFFNYEGLRERRGVESFRSVPVESWRNGDFSGVSGLVLRDPATGAPFPGNQIPAVRFSPTARVALKFWPKQNFGAPNSTANNFLISRPVEVRDDQYTIKIDHQIADHDHIMGRYSASHREEITTPTLPTFEQIVPPVNHVAALNYTHIFAPGLLLDLRFAFTRSLFVQSSPNSGNLGFYNQFGINNTIPGPQYEGAPTLTFTNVVLTSFGEGDFNVQKDVSNEFNYAAGLTWVLSNHALKAGFTLTRYQQNTPGPVTGARRGNFNFRGDFTRHAFADFLLGLPYTATRVVGKGVETGRSYWHGYYLNDDWKVNRNLTLNLGLRYEYVSPLVDILNRRSTFYPLVQENTTGERGQIILANSTEAKQLLNLSGVGARAVYAPDHNNWAPRIGLAYSLGEKTVLRGGFGVFYTNSQNFVNNFVINRRQPPFAETQTVTSSTATPQIDIANPFVNAIAALVIATQNINPGFREGYVQQWNLTVQRLLPRDLSLEAGYVGSKGTDLGELNFYNVPHPGPAATLQARRPFPAWGTALSLDSFVTSHYDSLQVKAQKRSSTGMSLLAAYTWSKSIDLSSERGNGERGGGFEGSGDPRNPRYSRGLSGFDNRHRLAVSFVYEIPTGQGKRFWSGASPAADKLISGWEISGIATYQSGFPFTVVQSGDPNGDGLPDRPDL